MQLRIHFRRTAREAEIADALEAGYVTWRQETDAVAESYRSWAGAPRGERRSAYDAYVAALEREERAAYAYRRLAEASSGAVAVGASC